MRKNATFDPWKNLATERANRRSRDLDRMPARAVARLILDEDRAALSAALSALPAATRVAEVFARVILGGGRVYYVGAGTSGRLGVIDAAELVPTFGMPFEGRGSVHGIMAGGWTALRRSVEGAEDDAGAGRAAATKRRIGAGDLVIGISASSLAPYVRAALKESKRRGAATALLTMNRVSRPAFVDTLVVAVAGPEVIAGSTRMKSGLVTKALLHNISTTAMVLCGKVYGNRMIDLRAWCTKLEARGARLIEEIGGVSRRRAAAILAASGGRVKTGLVMARFGVDRAEAERRLSAVRGDCRALLDRASSR